MYISKTHIHTLLVLVLVVIAEECEKGAFIRVVRPLDRGTG